MVGDAEVSNQKLGELFLRDAENPNEWLLNQMTERIGVPAPVTARAPRRA